VAVAPDLAANDLAASGLVLTPLTIGDAASMVTVLADPSLYRFTGGSPPSLEDLEHQYRRQTQGPWPPDERWLTWAVRERDGPTVGYVQATVTVSAQQATLAWVIGADHQRRGYAATAAWAVLGWLADHGVRVATAHILPGHLASEAVAAGVGLQPTGSLDAEGERIWRCELSTRMEVR
jgi:RimJ/RimL family protein N-acetyltransferase